MNNNATIGVRIILPDGFDDRREFETPLRGYLSDVIVELEGKRRYAAYFIDPVRLQQDLDEAIKSRRPYIAEPGLIVLPQVTLEAINQTVYQLWRDGFFDKTQPLES